MAFILFLFYSEFREAPKIESNVESSFKGPKRMVDERKKNLRFDSEGRSSKYNNHVHPSVSGKYRKICSRRI